MKTILSFIALLGVLLAGAPQAFARDYRLGTLEIHDPWARATPPSAPTAGGYMTITNKGSAPDRLVSIESPAAAKADIHEMKMDGSVMRMRAVDGAHAHHRAVHLHLVDVGLRRRRTLDRDQPVGRAALVGDRHVAAGRGRTGRRGAGPRIVDLERAQPVVAGEGLRGAGEENPEQGDERQDGFHRPTL